MTWTEGFYSALLVTGIRPLMSKAIDSEWSFPEWCVGEHDNVG